jgi:hypothetical protein
MTLAIAGAPVPPSVEVTVEVVFNLGPTVVPVTLSGMVQEPPGAIVAPVMETESEGGTPMVKLRDGLPQPDSAFTTVIARPAGSISVKPTPVSGASGFELVMVKARLVVPPSGISAAPNDLLIVGGATTTVTLAVFDAAPAPPSVEETADVVLLLTPPVVPLTVSKSVHEPLGAIVPPVIETESEGGTPMLKVNDAPPQPDAGFTTVIARPAGSTSEKPTPVSAFDALGLVIVIVRLVVPSSGMLAAPNALVIVGGATTVRVAVAVLPVPPLAETMALVVFTLAPGVKPVTFTEIVQAGVGGGRTAIPGRSVITGDPGKAITPALKHEAPTTKAGDKATITPAGKVSVKPIPVRVVPIFGFEIVKVRVLVPPTGIVAGANALPIVGGRIIGWAIAALTDKRMHSPAANHSTPRLESKAIRLPPAT